jgi:hypothetical protein
MREDDLLADQLVLENGRFIVDVDLKSTRVIIVSY